MSKTNQDYWRKRVEQEMAWAERRDRDLDAELRQLYLRHLNEIDREIQTFYQRYADNNHVSVREAKKRVSEMDVQAFADKAAQYVKEKNFGPQANEELAVYNLAMKVSRLEMLQYNIDLQLIALGDEEQKLTKGYLQDNYQSGVRSQAGILGESVIRDFKTNKTLMDTVINTSFHGVTWKSATMERQQALRQVMSNVVERSVLRGENPIKFLNEIQKEMNSSRYAARRLAITEGTKAATMTQMAMLRQSEYDHYEVICERNACEICKPFDEKPQPLDGQLIGTNAPPFHPHCRCSVCASVPEYDKNQNKPFEIVMKEKIPELVHNAIQKSFDKINVKRDYVLSKERLNHIKEGHSDIGDDIPYSLKKVMANPESVLEDHKNKNSLLIFGNDGENEIVISLKLSDDYKDNSIITAIRLSLKRKQRYMKKNKIIYTNDK